MTVSTTLSREVFVTDGVVVAFSFNFKINATSDLVVTHYDALGAATLLTEGIDYTVSAAPWDSGGTVTTTTAQPAGNIVISRSRPYTQGTSWPKSGPFPAESHENAADSVVMLVQQVKDLVDRAFILSENETASIDTILPSPVSNLLLGWAADGLSIENKTITDLSTTVISAFMSGLLQLSNASEVRDDLDAEQRFFYPTESATPGMSVSISAGRLTYSGELISKSAQTATIEPADANPRIDRIVLSADTGIVSVIKGTAASSPSAPAFTDTAIPALTSDAIPICQVSIPAGDTAITDDQITDERPFLFSRYDEFIGDQFFPHEAATPALSVLVNSGRVRDGASLNIKAQQTAVIEPADTINPRIDRVVLSADTGIVSVIKGTATATPSAPAFTSTAIPALTGDAIPICQVSVPAGASTITNSQITDERALFSLSGTDVSGYVSGNTEYLESTVGSHATAFGASVVSGSWYTVGKTTGSAAQTWAALDIVPSNAKWIEVKFYSRFQINNPTIDANMSVYARKEGISTAIGQQTQIVYERQGINPAPTNDHSSGSLIHGIKIPIDGANANGILFNLYYEGLNLSAVTANMYLVGWGT